MAKTEMWNPDWKLEVRTAEELEEIQTATGVRKRLALASRNMPLITQVLRMAEYQGLSGEDTYVYLAYHALVSLEKSQQAYIDYVNRTPSAPMIIGAGGALNSGTEGE